MGGEEKMLLRDRPQRKERGEKREEGRLVSRTPSGKDRGPVGPKERTRWSSGLNFPSTEGERGGSIRLFSITPENRKMNLGEGASWPAGARHEGGKRGKVKFSSTMSRTPPG